MAAIAYSRVTQVGFRLSNDRVSTNRTYVNVVNDDMVGPSGTPKEGGVYDARMGTTGDTYVCQTCKNTKRACLGHPGLMKPNIAMCQPVAVSLIRHWLKVTCFNCGACVVPPEKYAKEPVKRRLAAASSYVTAATGQAGLNCSQCTKPHVRVVQDPTNLFMFVAEATNVARRPRGRAAANVGDRIYPNVIAEIFERITDETVVAMGYDPELQHPRGLIINQIIVTPTTTRPNTYAVGGIKYNDTTVMYHHIERRANHLIPSQLPQAMLSWAHRADQVPDELIRTTYNQELVYNNMVMGSGSGDNGRNSLHVGSQPAKGLMGVMAGKEGRIRGNIMGARVIYIARDTISGDSRIKPDEVGVPEFIARTLQVEETFQEFNAARLMRFLTNGQHTYPGSTLLWKKADERWYTVSAVGNYIPTVGDMILRDLVDGDLMYVNRQPTLERSSIGVHKVRIVKYGDTLRFNVLSCVYYNADFDGDQMNCWAARGPAARAEASVLSGVENWVISTAKGTPVNGQVQDSVLGCYLISRERVVIARRQAMELFSNTHARLGPSPPTSGRELLSMLIPRVNMSKRPTSAMKALENFLAIPASEMQTVIKDGLIVSGTVDKAIVGEGAFQGVNHLVALEYGCKEAIHTIFNMQQLAISYATQHGFSCGMCDIMVSQKCRKLIDEVVRTTLLDAETVSARLLRGEIVPPIGRTVSQFYEELCMNVLKVPDAQVLQLIMDPSEMCFRGRYDQLNNGTTPYPGGSNEYLEMIRTGAKGALPHILNVVCAVGQVITDGARAPESFAFRRTLPYYPRYDTDPAAKGFTRDSYIGGLGLTEFIFGACSGRVDLVRKALTTADTGYMTRKGVVALQSCVINNHRQVVVNKNIIQLLYGDDGCDPRRLRSVVIRALMMDDAQILEHVGQRAGPASALREDRDWARAALIQLESSSCTTRGTASTPPSLGTFMLPFDVNSAVQSVMFNTAAETEAKPPSKKTIDFMFEVVDTFCSELPYVYFNEFCRARRAQIPDVYRAATRAAQLSIRSELGEEMLRKIGTTQKLQMVIDKILLDYQSSLIDYGTSAGINAVHCVSAPMTQYMLDSHHRSTEGGTSTAGLTRVNEIFKVLDPSKEQTPTMRLVLKNMPEDPESAMRIAETVAVQLEFLQLTNFVNMWSVCYERPLDLVVPAYLADKIWIADYIANHTGIPIPADLTRWVLRMEISKMSLVLKGVSIETIVAALRIAHPNGAWIAHTLESTPQSIVIRMWYTASWFPQKKSQIRVIEQIVRNTLLTPIRGVSGILQAKAKCETRHAVQDGGKLVRVPEYVVRTRGSNMQGAILHERVDASRSTTSSIGETYLALGNKAAAQCIMNEVMGFMESSAPNPRHLQIYALGMTVTGAVTSLERFGLAVREGNNVLLGMVSATPVQVLTEAAISCEAQDVYGYAAQGVLGATPQSGSMFNSLVVNTEFVRSHSTAVDALLDAM